MLHDEDSRVDKEMNMLQPAAGRYASERPQDGETYTVEQASQNAVEWCAKRPAWVRICDLPEGYLTSLHVQWSELSGAQQKRWGSETAYNEWATKRCKVAFGFISGKGEFYHGVLEVPLFHNWMTVFRVGVKAAAEMRGGKDGHRDAGPARTHHQ